MDLKSIWNNYEKLINEEVKVKVIHAAVGRS